MKTNVITGDLVYNSLKPLDLSNFTKEQVKTYFKNTYDVYETLFTSLNDDSWYYTCPDRLRLPLIFYYGHTSAVYMNKLVLSNLVKPHERINKEFETIFETGVDEMSWDDIENYRMGGSYKWPSVKDTHEYRAKVRELIEKVIDRSEVKLPVKWDEQWWAVFMGFEHERIHLETSSVLIRQLPIDAVSKPLGWKYGPFKIDNVNIKNEMIYVPETKVHLGKEYDFPSYGWDNEYGGVDCTVSAFEASKYKITNEEFLEFINAGGYETREYWSDEGWEWCQFKQAKHPPFWVCPNACKSGCGTSLKDYTHCQAKHFTKKEQEIFNNFQKTFSNGIEVADGEESDTFRHDFPYKFRLMFDVIDMPFNWPVEINYHEAKAYCNWKGDGYRLLSEAEHHAIRDNEPITDNVLCDIIYQDRSDINHNMVLGSSTPVNYYASNSKGFNDVFGNVWEWCEDHFNGLPGFKTTYIYDDFSLPCFDGRHNIIMGGSWMSTGDEASRFARFMFRRHFLQHCGFRLARSVVSNPSIIPNPQIRLVSDSVYILGQGFTENPIVLDPKKVIFNQYPSENKQYQYDVSEETLENEIIRNYDKQESKWLFSLLEQLKQKIDNNNNNIPLGSLLHIGASTGRLTFELSKYFDKIVALDFCAQFIDFCNKIQSQRQIDHDIIKFELNGNKNSDRIQFLQMSWLPNEIPSSDFVLFTNIDLVQNPNSWLRRFRELVNKNGCLAIYSETSKWTSKDISLVIDYEFKLINETQLDNHSFLTLWKFK